MNHWPGTRLRVTEAWDEDSHHSRHSLHYEGRAVDLTTSDRDRRKYGMLARLAVEAGFDWVYFESRSHVHASCKSGKEMDTAALLLVLPFLIFLYYLILIIYHDDRYTVGINTYPSFRGVMSLLHYATMYNFLFFIYFAEASSPDKAGGGCFSVNSTVVASDGRRLRMNEVRPGDRLLSADPDTGELDFSPVLLFLDRDEDESRRFVTLRTADGRELTLTPTHLVYAAKREDSGGEDLASTFAASYAGDLAPGDVLLVATSTGEVAASELASVSTGVSRGVYAPLTERGNLVVDGVVASCYAVVDSQAVAHAAFWPLRAAAWAARTLGLGGDASESPGRGVHWYAGALYSVAQNLIPNHLR